MRLTKEGFRLTFTTAMDAERLAGAKTWRVSRFRYLYLPSGSPRADEAPSKVAAIRPSAEARSVELALADLEPGYIYEVEPEGLVSAEGRSLENPLAFYTLNRLLDGRGFTGPMSEPLLIAKAESGDGPDPEAGRQVYATFCGTCHQPDGSGGGLPGAQQLAAANFRQRGPDGPLAKPDEVLLKIITEGAEEKPMPPFGGVLQPGQIRDVLAYLRAAFGEENP